MSGMTYLDAVNEALKEAMREDENVIIIGEDIGRYGGGFGATNGLLDEFGKDRMWQTPISETSFTGAAVGAALMGLRPVVEIMFADFTTLILDPLMNHAVTYPMLSKGRLSAPLVIRTAMGSGTGAASQHSHSVEALFANIPGLKVLAPSTPQSAKALLKEAIKDDSPVMFLEHKMLYKMTQDDMQTEDTDDIIIGKSKIRKSGKDITLISYSYDTVLTLKAARELEKEGISCEVVDLMSLRPLDTRTVISSVSKTGKACVIYEASKFAGFGAEVVSTICESEAFYSLKAPVKRIAGAEMPTAYTAQVEKAQTPSVESIIRQVKEVMNN